jgi:GTP-binding protein
MIEAQAEQAIEESDLVLFLVDGKQGLTAADEIIAGKLRNLHKQVGLLVNKTERQDKSIVTAEFHALGLGEPIGISAVHGEGIGSLQDYVLDLFADDKPEVELEDEASRSPHVAIVGRPNVGKSTLVNRLLKEERVLAYDMPGTTRDSIYIPFEYEEQEFVLIDTAGVRRRAKIDNMIEKFSVVKSLQAIDQSNVVILVIDAHSGISNQDASLLGYVLDAGKALLIAVNKWDGLSKDERVFVQKELDRKLSFVEYASIHYISALHGTGVGKLMAVVQKAYSNSRKQFSASRLTRILEDAVMQHQPPLVKGRRIKLRYAHQGGQNPPIIVIHGNQTGSVPDGYRRYLANIYRKILKLDGTPVRIQFKTGENPYEGRKNKLTKRQVEKRKRLKKFVKRKK